MSACNRVVSGKATSSVPGDEANDSDSIISTSLSTQILCDNPEPSPILSKRRWLILISVCLFGFSLALQNTSPVLRELLLLLDLDVDKYLYIDLIFNYLIALFAIPAAAFLDIYGIRRTILMAMVFFVLSNFFTTLLYFTNLPGWHHHRIWFYITTHLFKTMCFAMFYLLPLKVSETWFAASERTLAWTIMFLQMEVGNCLVSFAYPRIILGIDDFEILAYVAIVTAVITVLACVSLVTRSKPDTPPSKRAAEKKKLKILPSLKRMLKRSDILLQSIHQSIYASVVLTFCSVIQDILASIGHSQIFTGNYMLANSALSIILSIVMSSRVHKVSNLLMACKVGSFLQAVQYIMLLMSVLESAPGLGIIGLSVGLTIFRSFTVPINNEMTAHLIVGIVSEPVIIGFQLVTIPILMSVTQTIFAYLIQKHEKTNDYHNSLLFLIGVCIVNEVFYQVFFQGKKPIEPESDSETSDNRSQVEAATR